MPKCPIANCQIEWVWDNHLVNYRQKEIGTFCRERVILNEQTDDKDGIIVTIYQCLCGAILGFSANDPIYGGPVFNHPEWDQVDWND